MAKLATDDIEGMLEKVRATVAAKTPKGEEADLAYLELGLLVVKDFHRIADALDVLANDARIRHDAMEIIGLDAMISAVMTEKGWVLGEDGKWSPGDGAKG